MPLSANQKSLLVATISYLASIGTYIGSMYAANPAQFPAWVAIVPGGIGTLVAFLNNFEEAGPAQQQAIIGPIQSLGPLLQKFESLPSAQQQELLAMLPKLIPYLQFFIASTTPPPT